MQLYAVNSDIDNFWHDQNQKLLANEGFHSEEGDIFSDTLCFLIRSNGSKSRLNFDVFDKANLKMDNVATLTLNGISYQLSMKEYAKLVIVNSITPQSVCGVLNVYQMVVHLAGFLNTQESMLLTSNNIEDFHLSYLTQSITEKGISNRLTPQVYRASYSYFNFVKKRHRLQALGVEGVFDKGLSIKIIESTLDRACQSVMGIKLAEYKVGGSFNYLGLEVGQYYVDHMRRVYEADYYYSFVCQNAINLVSQQFNFETLEDNSSRGKWMKVQLETIQGTFVPDKKIVQESSRTRNKINNSMKEALFDQYQHHFEKIQSLGEQNIQELAKELGLTIRFDVIEVIRVLMLQKYYSFTSSKTPESVWNSYLSSLDKTHIDCHKLKNKTVTDIYAKMTEIISKKQQDKVSFLAVLSKWSLEKMVGKDARLIELTREFDRVSAAMISLVVAWLGYRKSEFGFPLNAIHIEPNLDILDNSYVPFRFKLKWIVPKTNKKTKIDREITSQCYQLAVQLSEFLQQPEGAPCLYKQWGRDKNKTTPSKSGVYIDKRVKENWDSFVTQYQPFNEVSELQYLSQLDEVVLSSDEKEKLHELSQEYDLLSARTHNLLATCREVRRDLARLNCTSFGGCKPQARFKKSLLEYSKTGDISNTEHKKIVEEYLSEDTKAWLKSDEVNLDHKGMLDIGRELTQSVRYPSPHAFRHIWAEAVLTRYQGNVGAVIRHQFCHMDESFFMAYLRDKEPKSLVKTARIRVLNSIVDTLLIDAHKIGQTYLGGFSRYVKKATKLTKAVTQSELLALRERIVGRVISIQPSYFATCLPREGAESRAKCATFGEVNPQNAKPEFCLNCTNAMITEGNLKGIWMTIQPFVKESLSENVMGFMVGQHLPILLSGKKRIKSLETEKNTESVSKILHVINKAIHNIKAKLKEEDGLYV